MLRRPFKLLSTNVKAYCRAVKASVSLNMLDEVKSYYEKGLQVSPDNEEIKKLAKQIDVKKSEIQRRELEVSKALGEGPCPAFEDSRIKFGKAMYQELTGIKKPVLDKINILHWHVVLLYAEMDMFSAHLDMMFSDSSPPLPWDTEHKYARDAIELYYEGFAPG